MIMEAKPNEATPMQSSYPAVIMEAKPNEETPTQYAVIMEAHDLVVSELE